MSATASPKVSVIVPVHNTAPWLDRCVESVRAQTLRDIEIILVENRSTDASPELCDAYPAADARIRVLHLAEAGLSRARNAGLAVATAPTWGSSTATITSNPTCSGGSTTLRSKAGANRLRRPDLRGGGGRRSRPKPAGPVTVRTPDEVLCDLLLERISASACTKLFDRTLFEGLQFPARRLVRGSPRRPRMGRPMPEDRPCGEGLLPLCPARRQSICHSFSAPKHYHFFLANFERFEFVRRQRLFEGRTEQDAICDKLVRNCLYNFREAMRRRHAPDFAEAVADMRRKLARMYEVKAQLPPATRKRLRRVVKHYGWYYLTHFVFRKKR